MKELLILGASGYGKVVADIARRNGYEKIIFLDDNEKLKKCGTYRVAGTSKDIEKYPNADCIVAIGNAKVRERILKRFLECGKKVVTLIHPNAVIAEYVEIGVGTVVMAGAVINSNTRIGKGVIVNTCSSIDHDCVIGDYVHVSVGSHVAGTVRIEKRTWVGAGATVSNNLEICEDCMIGAGAVVVKNIERSGTYIGVPAERK